MNTGHLDTTYLLKLIREIKIAMFTTVNADGIIFTRPMVTPAIDEDEFDGTLWFFSKKNSLKNNSIENDQHVNLAYSRPDKHHYISVSGRAIISHDKELMFKLWDPQFKLWFPEGLMDPELSLIGVKVENAEIWDSPVTKTAQMISSLKSAITGKPNHVSYDAHHVDLENRQ